MDKVWIGIYIGFAFMIIALVLQAITTGLTANLDKYSIIPDAYRYMMYSSVIIFFIGLIIVMLTTLFIPDRQK